ncbi:MAG TPA: tetratricopeptide repeat protein [Bacteroidales bacterium]|nr:tetratricopeptide repeat protein [Bacteroidales bacterium]
MKPFNVRPVLLLALLLTMVVSTTRSQDLNSAIQLIRSEQYDSAEEMLKQMIQKEPSNSKNYFYLGENYLLNYFSDTISNSLTVSANMAKEVYQKGVDANSNEPLNYIGLAKVAFYLGDNVKAAEHRAKAKSFLLPYRNLKRIDPPAKDYAFILAKIAESYIKDDQVDTSLALPLIREAIKIDNKSRDVYLIAGDIYILKNDGSKAISYYNQAQMADPESPTANMKIGNIYVKGRALQAAIPYFEQAIELNANYAPAYRELGQVYMLAQRFSQAKENFDKYLELTAGNIPAKVRYVTALFYAKDYEGVITNVEDIFKVDKSRTYMNRIAGYSCYEKTPPDYDKALAYMETLFATVSPERIIPKDYHYMARILIKKNQNEPKIEDDALALRAQINKDKTRLGTIKVAAEKAKLAATIEKNTATADSLEKVAGKMKEEIKRAFENYDKLLEIRPNDRSLLGEMASTYNSFKDYNGVARTLGKMLGPLPDSKEDYMQVGRAYYNGEKFTSADSIFTIVAKAVPDYVPSYLWVARTYSKMDPDTKLGLAKPKFEKVVEVAAKDSVKNVSELAEALGFLGYFHMTRGNYTLSKAYYNRLVEVAPNNKDHQIRGYSGVGLVELRLAGTEKTNEGRLPYIARSADANNKILALDPNNASAKSQIAYLKDFEAAVKKGINPNEIKGVIKDAASGSPVAYASIRVKDTAAENMTNQRGEYKFEIPSGSEILIISAKGYITQEIPITKSRVYNVSLSK